MSDSKTNSVIGSVKRRKYESRNVKKSKPTDTSISPDKQSPTASDSTPTKIMGSAQPFQMTKERHVNFSRIARVKLIPADQFPPRPANQNRNIPNPLRRLWVLYRLFKLGGHFHPKPGSREYDYVDPNTPWPAQFGPPPPPPRYKIETTFEQPETNDDLDRT